MHDWAFELVTRKVKMFPKLVIIENISKRFDGSAQIVGPKSLGSCMNHVNNMGFIKWVSMVASKYSYLALGLDNRIWVWSLGLRIEYGETHPIHPLLTVNPNLGQLWSVVQPTWWGWPGKSIIRLGTDQYSGIRVVKFWTVRWSSSGPWYMGLWTQTLSEEDLLVVSMWLLKVLRVIHVDSTWAKPCAHLSHFIYIVYAHCQYSIVLSDFDGLHRYSIVLSLSEELKFWKLINHVPGVKPKN